MSKLSEAELFINKLNACNEPVLTKEGTKHAIEIIENQLQEIERLNKKIEQYENPEDMTLMFMWCDEKAKDEIKRLNNIIKELDKQNGELGAELSITKDRIDKTNWWLEQMLKQATNNETRAIISGTLELLLGSDKE